MNTDIAKTFKFIKTAYRYKAVKCNYCCVKKNYN